MRPLTAAQERVLRHIRKFTAENGKPPTYRDIMVRCQFRSPNGVRGHVLALEAKGHVRLDYGTSRGIHLAGPEDLERASIIAKLSTLPVEKLRDLAKAV